MPWLLGAHIAYKTKISGLCCVMGIDTPTRFEAPQECNTHIFIILLIHIITQITDN